MRISDWSSDVCSSDLDRPACRRRMLSAAVSRARRICCPALCAPVAKVPDVMALRAGLGFVARFRRSEEHTSELQSLMRISYAVFCLKKKNNVYNDYDQSPAYSS